MRNSSLVLSYLKQAVCTVLLCAVASTGGAVERDTFFGMHLHRADSGTAWPDVGIGAWRLWDTNTRWPDLEPQRGRWEFSRLDRFVAISRLTKADLLLPLGMTPLWASARPSEKSSYQPGQAAEPANMDDWRRYVRTVAERYKGRIHHYEIWNEINEKGFYSGSVEKMVELTCEAHSILHEVDSANKLVSPSYIGAGSEPDQLENFLRKGGRLCVDIVGYHFYVPHREPEEIVPLVQRVRSAMARQGLDQMPLWNTEAGWWMASADNSDRAGADARWRRVSLEDGAAVVARTLVLGRWAGLERFYWYAWDNSILGLVEGSGSIKPGGRAYGTIARWMNQAVPSCTNTPVAISADGQSVWVCTLDSSDKDQSRRIVWSTRPGKIVYRPPASERINSIETLDGQTIKPLSDTTATIGYEPLLFSSSTVSKVLQP